MLTTIKPSLPVLLSIIIKSALGCATWRPYDRSGLNSGLPLPSTLRATRPDSSRVAMVFPTVKIRHPVRTEERSSGCHPARRHSLSRTGAVECRANHCRRYGHPRRGFRVHLSRPVQGQRLHAYLLSAGQRRTPLCPLWFKLLLHRDCFGRTRYRNDYAGLKRVTVPALP
jgi:hypothetical protein